MFQGYPSPMQTENDNWWLSDRNQVQGPLSWESVVFNVNSRKVTVNAQIKHDSWPNWVPITSYFHPKTLINPDVEGIIPGRYDLMFYTGIGIFILGIFIIIGNLIFGMLLFVCSLILEIGAIYLERKKKLTSKMSTLGNICAGVFIAIQILAMIFFAFMLA